MRERARPIHDADPLRFQMLQVIDRVENYMAQAALPRRRAHAVEYQRVIRFAQRRIVRVFAGVNFLPVHAARVQLLKQRPVPIRVLVVNADRFRKLYPAHGGAVCSAHDFLFGCLSLDARVR